MNEKVIDNLNIQLDKAIEKGKQIVENEELLEKAEELKSLTETTIRKHPIRTVLIGVGIGYLLGKIFSSND
ncbi:MAG: hypothetical protein WC967_06720 [Balneolaceae bacterium]